MQLESSFSTNEPPLETQFPSDEERFYLPDEPEFYDLLSSQIEDKLRKSLPKWLKKDITINDKYSNVRIRTKIFLFVQSCPAIIKHTAGFTKEDAVRSFFYTLGELVKKRSEIISEIPTNTLTAITRASMAFALGREETEKNNTARIIDPKSLNPLTVVFAEQCFESPKSLGFQKEDAVAVIAHIGYCLGYFDEDEPRSQYFRAVFTEKLGDGAPPVVTETGEIGKVTSDRLQSLKDFWPQVYALAVTSVAIKNNKGTLLDPRDEMKARGRLHKDKRTAPIRSALLSIKNAMKGRDASTSDIENVDAAFTREEQKLSDQVKNQKRNVKRAFFDIVQSYNPDVTHYHVNEVPVINTEVLKPKSEKILSIFVQEAKGIHGDTSRSTKLALVATTATKMIDFVERGDRSIDLENLFGKDFYTIDPIEQVALLLYAAIQHVQQGNRTKLAMQLLGTSFQKLLQSHTDEPMDIPENESNIVFSEPGWEITDRVLERSDEALERLYADSDPDDGFIVSADEDVLLKNRAENKEQLKELFTAIEDRGVMPFLMQLVGLTMGGCAAILLTLEALAGDAYSSGISPAILSVITVSSMILSFRVQGLIGRGASGVGDTLLDELLQTVNSSESIDVDSLEKKRRKKQNSMMRKLLLVFLTLMLIVPALDATSQVVDIVMTERGRSTNEMSDITNEVDMLALYNRPYQIGDVYHIPESIERENADYGMRFFQPTLIVGPDRERSVGWGFGEDVYFEVVDSIDENTHTAQPDELVYSFPSSSISRFNRVIHPFDGYEITKIYQLGGTEPIATREGGIYYDNNPSEVLLVTRRAEVITEFDAMEGTGYRYGSVWMQPGLRGRVYSLGRAGIQLLMDS